ncbi:hypothetical protein J4E83_009488 [Alternaria metachromatica]|uniref:uncharacterized protein n=1 Tax=Alternaria metachromatica TaxID=283354 RepID=UPI0020C3B08B|nr:uncharacterized protein J4E83_009488 [Alternaria metachromatica]KAI4607591.1 hypothetical protein J4E83_009488 [Alternaria metachromatica]
MSDTKKATGTGWSDRDLLSSLLYLVNKNGSVFNYNEGCYPAGRNASGFKQKINALKNVLKPEWEAMEAGVPVSEVTPKKAATPRKRKAKTDEDADDAEVTPKKGRGRPKKKKEPTPEVEEDLEDETVKEEVKDDDDDDILKEAEDI